MLFRRQKDLVERFSTFMVEQLLLPTDAIAALGLAYHVCDLYVEELKNSVGDSKPVPQQTLATLLQPFCTALVRAGKQALINRVRWGKGMGLALLVA